MSNDFIPASEAEFLTFAATFNARISARAALLGIPDAVVTGNTAKLAATPPPITLPKPPTRANSTAKTAGKSART
jgi:hypothetical protein